MRKIQFLFIVISLLFIGYLSPTFAAEETVSEIMKGVLSSFSLPLRDLLKKERFNKNFKVFFSGELGRCKEMGSFISVPGSFGLTMCSVTIQKLLSEK